MQTSKVAGRASSDLGCRLPISRQLSSSRCRRFAPRVGCHRSSVVCISELGDRRSRSSRSEGQLPCHCLILSAANAVTGSRRSCSAAACPCVLDVMRPGSRNSSRHSAFAPRAGAGRAAQSRRLHEPRAAGREPVRSTMLVVPGGDDAAVCDHLRGSSPRRKVSISAASAAGC